ncbi:hypothetical protein OSB04_012532 [Centaurea solstitialis]|uniref:Transposase n=1 Tax=Centaurea solstitialis TaxID=347529 RepID=A0AA38TWA2_9ASTR|nr:hypothetical protein OSB04_012532 [Centaurea solstitialis]
MTSSMGSGRLGSGDHRITEELRALASGPIEIVKRKREDENGFTLLNFKGLKPHNEPFILACQAQQVFYVADSADKEWQVMIKTTARDFYDMNEQPSLDHVDTYLQSEVFSRPQIDEIIDGSSHKRVRGPTYMPSIWAREEGDRISVEFNEYGQPIDKETTNSLSHFMGSLARSGKYCPVDKAWHQVKATKKGMLLNFLETKFDLPPGSDDWILKSFAKKVRNWRARIKKDYYDPSLSLKEQIKSKPKRVRPDQWNNLIKNWNKEEAKKISERNKNSRGYKKMVQVTGKKSFARVREELKESLSGREPSRMELFVACFSKDGTTKNIEAKNAIEQMLDLNFQLPEGSLDEPGPDDVFSKVMGKDKHGSARMYGLGVRASDVWGVFPSRAACYRESMLWKKAYIDVSKEVAEVKAMILAMQGSNEYTSSVSSAPVTAVNPPQATTELQPLKVGDVVHLKSIINSMEIVARGRIRSLDPDELVGGEEIGPNWCEVHVLVAIKRQERLVRPHGLFITVEDAIGATIAWPCPFTLVVHDED